jgi:hypothetical protein
MKRNGGSEMINVHDFCDTCADGTIVKLFFYDIDTRDFITDVAFHNAKAGVSTLKAAFYYANVESIYVNADVIYCMCYVINV